MGEPRRNGYRAGPVVMHKGVGTQTTDGTTRQKPPAETMELGGSHLTSLARESLGNFGQCEGLGSAVARSQSGWRLVVTLGVFAAADQTLSVLLALLGPEIRSALGLSEAQYGLILSQRSAAVVIVAFQFALVLHYSGRLRRPPTRRLLALYAVFATGVGALGAAFASSFWGLLVSVAVTSPTAGALWVVHRPMIMDGYVPSARVRAMSIHQSGIVAAAVFAPLLLGLMSRMGLSWRGALFVTASLTLLVAGIGLPLREPDRGRHDTDVMRTSIRQELHTEGQGVDELTLGFSETLRRLWLIPTMRRLLAAWAVVGMTLAPLVTYMMFFVFDRWHLGVGDRALFLAAAWGLALPALAFFALRGDRLFGIGPEGPVAASATILAVLAGGLLLAVATPWLPAALVGFGTALAASSVLIPVLMVTTLSLVEPEARSAAGALIAFFLLVVGGLAGGVLLGGLDSRFGAGLAIALLAAPALVAAQLLRRAAHCVSLDVDQMVSRLVEAEEVSALAGRGVRLPMLACRHVDFSYGQLQVLFNVDFSVDEGEIVALLGTNGAGKSTLLRVICGLGAPSRGSVRLGGRDVTHLDAERRVSLGISQVPGGRAVFGPLTVVDNMRVLGYTHGRNRRAVEAGIEASFDAFPALAQRRNQPAATLSGGEQQMLGLATAFIVKPQLLLIDELSLGLAPKVVGELLQMVRRINAAGTAVVLVEQSVNVALSVVQHAYFMEKGEIRFDGAAADLLSRPELLRSVFLEGAGRRLAPHAAGPKAPQP